MGIFDKKLFGSDLFSFKKKSNPGLMYDFAQHGLFNENMTWNGVMNAIPASMAEGAAKKSSKKKNPIVAQITPKGIYALKCLNDNKFKIISDKKYLEEQIAVIKEKLALLPKREKIKINRHGWGIPEQMGSGAVEFARQELESIMERLENRLKLDLVKEESEKYPYTTAKLVSEVLEPNKHLRCQKADSFVPDFPRDAIKAMADYNEMCIKLCGKKTHFYVIAKVEDFQKINKRRDPILLAQSPFGFFWQILGAWDEEMIYLGDL